MSDIQKCPNLVRGGGQHFQKCLKFKTVPNVGGGEGSTLIGTLSQIFSFFFSDASPNQILPYQTKPTIPNLPNKICQTKPPKQNIPDRTCQHANITAPNLNLYCQIKSSQTILIQPCPEPWAPAFSQYGQMSPGQQQMSSWQMESAEDGSGNRPLKLSRNLVINSWDIPDMDRCRQDKYSLDCHSWHLLKMFPGTFLSSLVKMGSVTADMDKYQDYCCLVKIGPVTPERLLIWTNVARTNVAWTIVHLTIVLDWEEWVGNSLLRRFYD